TEGAWFDAERRVAARYGVTLPEAARTDLHGLDVHALLDALRGRYGVPAARDDLATEIEAAVADALTRTPARPGAAALVAHLAERDHPRAVVSNAPHAAIRATLAPHAFGAALPVRISAGDVPRGKPAPDPYLAAVARLGVAPDRTLAVEDSLPGARAAVAAGATCVLLTHGELDPAAARRVTPHVVASFAAWRPDLVRDSGVAHPGAAPSGAPKEAP
ncbi:MAG: HAD family phosphatase, partial [Trueperaceae bacterium]|nr:HAD family phosphatase [Trueperaceae bacterium]